MKKKLYGTRFTTGCGHSWHRPYPKWTARDLGRVTTDCVVCGELLIIPAEQFEGCDLDQFPINVHAPLFHKYLNQQDRSWPADGAGTYSAAIEPTEGE